MAECCCPQKKNVPHFVYICVSSGEGFVLKNCIEKYRHVVEVGLSGKTTPAVPSGVTKVIQKCDTALLKFPSLENASEFIRASGILEVSVFSSIGVYAIPIKRDCGFGSCPYHFLIAMHYDNNVCINDEEYCGMKEVGAIPFISNSRCCQIFKQFDAKPGPRRFQIHQFPSPQAFQTWRDSAESSELMKELLLSANANLITFC